MINNDGHNLKELGVAFSIADREMLAADAGATNVERKKATEKWLHILRQVIVTPAANIQDVRIKAGVMLMVVRATKPAPGLLLDMALSLTGDVLSDLDQDSGTSNRRSRRGRKPPSKGADMQ